MIVSKLGDSLAVRVSADEALRLGLKEGDEVEVRAVGHTPAKYDQASRDAALERLRRFEGTLAPGFKFNRDEANER